MNYAKSLPHGKDGTEFQNIPPPLTAIARSAAENSSASSVLTVSSMTTAIEIAAVGAPAAMRWVATSDTQASVVSAVASPNFDYIIPTGTVRRFVIPQERVPSNNPLGSVQGINLELGLYQRFAIKSIGIASVLTSEY